jgi:hypothetical protein
MSETNEASPANKVSDVERVVMFPVFHLILKPLIRRNYRLRELSAISGDGKYPDKWYWADSLAIKYGYYVET